MKYRCPNYDAIGEAKAIDGVIDVTPEVAVAMNLGAPIEDVQEPPADPVKVFLAQNAAAIIETVKTVPTEKLAELQAVRDAEAASTGKQRSTVLAAIDARLEELTAPPAE